MTKYETKGYRILPEAFKPLKDRQATGHSGNGTLIYVERLNRTDILVYVDPYSIEARTATEVQSIDDRYFDIFIVLAI